MWTVNQTWNVHNEVDRAREGDTFFTFKGYNKPQMVQMNEYVWPKSVDNVCTYGYTQDYPLSLNVSRWCHWLRPLTYAT